MSCSICYPPVPVKDSDSDSDSDSDTDSDSDSDTECRCYKGCVCDDSSSDSESSTDDDVDSDLSKVQNCRCNKKCVCVSKTIHTTQYIFNDNHRSLAIYPNPVADERDDVLVKGYCWVDAQDHDGYCSGADLYDTKYKVRVSSKISRDVKLDKNLCVSSSSDLPFQYYENKHPCGGSGYCGAVCTFSFRNSLKIVLNKKEGYTSIVGNDDDGYRGKRDDDDDDD